MKLVERKYPVIDDARYLNTQDPHQAKLLGVGASPLDICSFNNITVNKAYTIF